MKLTDSVRRTPQPPQKIFTAYVLHFKQFSEYLTYPLFDFLLEVLIAIQEGDKSFCSSTIFVISPAPEVKYIHKIASRYFLKVRPSPLYTQTCAGLAQSNGISHECVFLFFGAIFKIGLILFLHIHCSNNVIEINKNKFLIIQNY